MNGDRNELLGIELIVVGSFFLYMAAQIVRAFVSGSLQWPL